MPLPVLCAGFARRSSPATVEEKVVEREMVVAGVDFFTAHVIQGRERRRGAAFLQVSWYALLQCLVYNTY